MPKGYSDIIAPPEADKLHNELLAKAKEKLKKLDICELRTDLLVGWIESLKGKEVREILEMENVYKMIRGEYYGRVSRKLKRHMQLDKDDIAIMKLAKETLETLHRLKYGDKNVNINVSTAMDIRDMMFGEEKK